MAIPYRTPPGFMPGSIIRTPRLHAQRPGLRRVQAKLNEKKDEHDPDNALKGLKVLPALMSSERGVGVLITVAITSIAKVTAYGFSGVVTAIEKEMEPTMNKAPENLQIWQENVSEALKNTGAEAQNSFAAVKNNVSEAWAELMQSTESLNKQITEEAEVGARNWEKTRSHTIRPGAERIEARTNIVDTLAKAEGEGTEFLKSVGQKLANLSASEQSLHTGWAGNFFRLPSPAATPDEVAKAEDTQPVQSNTPTGPKAIVSAAPPAAIITKLTKGQVEGASRGDIESPDLSLGRSSTTAIDVKSDESPAAPVQAVKSDANNNAAKSESRRSGSDKKTVVNPILNDVMKGGRHVSMLSAPGNVPTTTSTGTSSLVQGYGRPTTRVTADNKQGVDKGRIIAGGMAASSSGTGREALRTAAEAISKSSSGAASTNGDGGNTGDDGGSGGGRNDDNDSEDGGSKGPSFFGFLLLALALAVTGYYVNQRRPTMEKK